MVVVMMLVMVVVVMMVMVVVVGRQFSNDRPPLGLETHLLLHQQEDGKGETC